MLWSLPSLNTCLPVIGACSCPVSPLEIPNKCTHVLRTSRCMKAMSSIHAITPSSCEHPFRLLKSTRKTLPSRTFRRDRANRRELSGATMPAETMSAETMHPPTTCWLLPPTGRSQNLPDNILKFFPNGWRRNTYVSQRLVLARVGARAQHRECHVLPKGATSQGLSPHTRAKQSPHHTDNAVEGQHEHRRLFPLWPS